MIPAHIEYINVIKLLRIAVSNCLFNFLKSTRLVASVTKFKREWMSILVIWLRVITEYTADVRVIACWLKAVF